MAVDHIMGLGCISQGERMPMLADIEALMRGANLGLMDTALH